MIHEFAIEPVVPINRLERRLLLAQLGIEHGRLIAEIPKFNKWGRDVLNAARSSGSTDMEIEKLADDLANAKFSGKVCQRNRRHPYDGNQSWITNAEMNSTELNAILAHDNPHNHPKVLAMQDFDGSDPRWLVRQQISIKRDGTSLAAICVPLFEISYRLKLVDPHFNPRENRWLHGLSTLSRAFEDGRRRLIEGASKPPTLELHVSDQYSKDDWRNGSTGIREVMPRGLSLRVVRWGMAGDHTQMHARFVLTELGGIHVDYGLDAPGRGTTHVNLMDAAFHADIWKSFDTARPDTATTQYELMSHFLIT